MTMVEILPDLDEPSRPAVVDPESPLTIPESELNLAEIMHWSQGFMNIQKNKNVFKEATKDFPGADWKRAKNI